MQVVRQGGSELDGPAVWTQLAECLQAVGDADGAIAMYQDVLSGAGRSHQRWTIPSPLRRARSTVA